MSSGKSSTTVDGIHPALPPKKRNKFPEFRVLIILLRIYIVNSKFGRVSARPGILAVFYSTALSIKIAQKPYITGSLDPKALTYESLEG